MLTITSKTVPCIYSFLCFVAEQTSAYAGLFIGGAGGDKPKDYCTQLIQRH
eukprot:XP_001706903.1 Hypothetical protein GL50803_114878 [Giardia lamblia ATCC 50803]